MKRFFLLLSIVIVSVSALAQENPERGFIITNENDTLFGYIDFRTDKINCSKCSFKVDGSEEYKTFMPGDIQGYRFMENGKFYVSRSFEYESKTHDVFAEYMVKGMLNVYRVAGLYPDYVYFFENEGEKAIGYRSRENLADQNSVDAVAEGRRLFTYLLKSEKSTKEVKIGYMPVNSVLKIAHQYHEDVCTSNEDCIEFEYDTKSEKTTLSYNVHAGWLHFFGFQCDMVKLYDMPMAGFTVEFGGDRLKKGLLYQITLDYAYGSGSYQNKNNYLLYHSKAKSHMLFVKVGPQYRMNTGKALNLTIRGGVSVMFGFTKEPYYMDRYVPLSDKWTSTLISDDSIVDANFCSAYGGVGLEYPLGHGAVVANIDVFSPHVVFVKGTPSITASVGYRF